MQENIRDISTEMFKKGERKIALLTTVLDPNYIRFILKSPLRSIDGNENSDSFPNPSVDIRDKHTHIPIILRKILTRRQLIN